MPVRFGNRTEKMPTRIVTTLRVMETRVHFKICQPEVSRAISDVLIYAAVAKDSSVQHKLNGDEE